MHPTHRVHHSLTHRRIVATSAGDIAVAALADVSRATILGCPSRGIFVQLDTQRVIFLSREQHHSPLTVTLPKDTPALDAIAPHDESHKIPHSLHTMWEAIQQLCSAFRAGDIETAIHAATPLFGRGQGLTPSGDDFMLGFTLTLNRWYDRTPWNGALKQYNTCVVEAARTHTTTLSASLIESATRGASDKRLVRTADYLAADMPSLAPTVTDVLQWESSSGIDVLAGMALAVTGVDESSL